MMKADANETVRKLADLAEPTRAQILYLFAVLAANTALRAAIGTRSGDEMADLARRLAVWRRMLERAGNQVAEAVLPYLTPDLPVEHSVLFAEVRQSAEWTGQALLALFDALHKLADGSNPAFKPLYDDGTWEKDRPSVARLLMI